MIRSANRGDADRIAALYNYYVEDTIITFEDEPVERSEMARRIERVIRTHHQPSVRLHEKLGFRRAGTLQEVGYKLGRWIDVEYWQLML